jgi:hypothetical protein
VFVPLDESISRRKSEYLVKCFRRQADKHWFSRDVFMSILRLRGVEGHIPSAYAEGFYCRKAVVAMGAG